MASWNDPDLEDLRRCRAGDRQAFAALVERHKGAVFRWIYAWVGSREGAEELSQDVFLKAYRNLQEFRGDSKFSTWLHRIALNRCRDHWRSGRRRPEHPASEQAFSRLEAPTPAPDAAVSDRRQGESLREALEELPDIYREALTLRFFGDLAYEEIAALLGENLSSVKMRVMRGLAQLRKKWKEE